VKRDDFKGLMLIPWWPRLNWFHELLILGLDHRRIHPESTGDFGLRRLDRGPLATARTPLKRWSAALIAFSPEACQRAAEWACGRIYSIAPHGARPGRSEWIWLPGEEGRAHSKRVFGVPVERA
jgi:hypothetical protein